MVSFMGKRNFWVGLVLVGTMICSLLWVTPVVIPSGGYAYAFTEEQRLLAQAWRIVNQAYLDETFNHQNWWLLRQKYLKRRLATREDTYEAIEEMLGTLDEPFTRLLRPQQYRSLQVSTSGELSGVGLQIDINPETKTLEVVAPIAGSPAAEAGIRARDRILEIDGVRTDRLSLEEAATRMRGKKGTTVTLTVQPIGKDKVQVVKVVRDRISLNPVYARLDQESASVPIGYLRLSQFSANATAELAHSIHNLEQQGAAGFILDLRNNPGGLLQAGIEIARLWLDDGSIVYTVNRQGMLGSFTATSKAITDAPLVVLVNQGTASASEILAGALHDNGRALLVGEKTFGKGLIQSLFELADGSGMAVTVAKYETPNHQDIHKQGITPDTIVPQEPINLKEVQTEVDQQYQVAIQVLTQKTVLAQNAS
jgi:carboxyl-terminal processing protease